MPGNPGAGTRFILRNVQYSHTNFLDISGQGHETDFLPDFCGYVLCGVLMWTHFLYCILVIPLCHLFQSHLSFWHRIFETLLILDNCRYQTHKSRKYYERLTTNTEIPHNTTSKIANHIYNINITFLHCKKFDYFEQVSTFQEDVECHTFRRRQYRQTSNIIHTLADNKIVDHQDAVGAYRRCSNYIFSPDITFSFNILHKDNCKTRRETFQFWNLVRLMLEIGR